MAHAVRVHSYGGPEALAFEEISVGEPAANQIRLRQTAIGVNFIDVYHRSGLYPQAAMPFIPGSEGAGVVEAVGKDVTHLKAGDRVAYAGAIGGYASERLLAADRAVKIPDGIDDQTAAAMMLQGMTVRYLIRKTYRVGPETTVLWHAAAGGVGQIAMQWLKHIGATVIGTAGGADKCALAKSLGATHVINYRGEDFVARVKEITGGKMCDVVYDSVGKDTFPASLDCLKPLGLFVSFGNASGPVEAFNIGILSGKGSLYVTRPTLATYTASRPDLEDTANDLFDMVRKGIVRINISKTYALKDVAQCHRDLEGRKTTGSLILVP